MKKTEWRIFLLLFFTGFVWGILKEFKVFYAVGGGLGLVILIIPLAIVIYLLVLLLRKIKLIKPQTDNDATSLKPRLFFRVYLWSGIVMGGLLILQEIFNLFTKSLNG